MNRRQQVGFTLIEMIVLIMILAVVTSLAVPSYWRMLSKSRFDMSVQNVLRVMSSARELAIQTGSDVTLKFDQQSETFMVTVDAVDQSTDVPSQMQDTQQSDPQSVQQPRITRVSDEVEVVGFRVNQPTNDSNAPNTAVQDDGSLHFYTDGSCDGATFSIVSNNNYRADIEVAPLTGKARVRDDLGQ